MASLPFTQFYTLPRWHSDLCFFPSINFVRLQDMRLEGRYVLTAIPKKKLGESLGEEASEGEDVELGKKKPRKATKRAPSTRSRKKEAPKIQEEDSLTAISGDETDDDTITASETGEVPKKTRRRTRKKVESTSSTPDTEEPEKKVTRRRRTKKQADITKDQSSEAEISDNDEDILVANLDDSDDDNDVELNIDEGEDISYTYGWPPLVCCFGAIQHAFVPSGKQANRLVDHEMHERMKDALWSPEKFVRAPGGCAGNVALILSNLGGNVALMGKLGDDDFGQALLYHMNVNKVQTRSVKIDSKRLTAVSHMKMSKRGGLRMTCVKPCAEDSLKKSEINIDVLKEAKMLYLSTFSLLDQKMRSSALQAVKIAKKLGGVIFYDFNLPLPLWQSEEETKALIKEVWELSDIIEVTKQELEFLCGIKPSERFDTKDNDRSKFVHYEPEVIASLWHENLRVLFVTNGTSKIHYYTKEHNGSVLGMEDAPITPFTNDMSATGDAIVAALMRKLTIHPHLITDKGYLEHIVKYAINRGVTEQWLQARVRGFPPKEGMEDDFPPDSNGIRTTTEKEYRTLFPVS